jgi:hypothetical protein
MSCSSEQSYDLAERESPKVKTSLAQTASSVPSQKCTFENLSKTYIYEICRNIEKKGNVLQYSDLKIMIKEKESFKLIDSIYINKLGYFTISEEKCSDAKSYQTNQNIKEAIVDNYFGFFIVADFNFDKRDDFAFLNGLESTSGPYYDFYTQGNNNKFKKDAFLTDSIGFFPSFIDKKNKLLTTEIILGAWGASKVKYYFDRKKNSWVIQSREVTDFTKK